MNWGWEDVLCPPKSPPPLFPSLDPDSTLTRILIVKDILSVFILSALWSMQPKYASSCESISKSYGAGGGSFVPLSCLENDWGGCNEVSSWWYSSCCIALETEWISFISLRNFIKTAFVRILHHTRYWEFIWSLSWLLIYKNASPPTKTAKLEPPLVVYQWH